MQRNKGSGASGEEVSQRPRGSVRAQEPGQQSKRLSPRQEKKKSRINPNRRYGKGINRRFQDGGTSNESRRAEAETISERHYWTRNQATSMGKGKRGVDSRKTKTLEKEKHWPPRSLSKVWGLYRVYCYPRHSGQTSTECQ